MSDPFHELTYLLRDQTRILEAVSSATDRTMDYHYSLSLTKDSGAPFIANNSIEYLMLLNYHHRKSGLAPIVITADTLLTAEHLRRASELVDPCVSSLLYPSRLPNSCSF
jgi:hypothetical protein